MVRRAWIPLLLVYFAYGALGLIDISRDFWVKESLRLSPADLAAMNVNLVGGDPYGGACTLDQFFVWRPLRSTVNHATPVKRLYHIGASTHPGPGLGGGSGFLLANALR